MAKKKKKTEYISVDAQILDNTRREIDFLREVAMKLLVIAISDSISDEDLRRANEVLENAKDYDQTSLIAAFVVGLRGTAKKILGEDVSFMEYLQYKKKEVKS
jgi:hypothetical protein